MIKTITTLMRNINKSELGFNNLNLIIPVITTRQVFRKTTGTLGASSFFGPELGMYVCFLFLSRCSTNQSTKTH